MNVKEKILYFVIGVMVGVFGMFTYTSTRNPGGTIQDIRKQQQSVNNEINGVGVNLNQAKTTVAGATNRVSELQGEIDNARERLAENQRQLDNIARIVRESKSLAEENGRIFETFREENR